MATWIAHMRIAEHFMKKDKSLNNELFLVGNIGPDCGVPNEDWSRFTPDKYVSHWHTKSKGDIDSEDFKSKYLLNNDSDKYPFYLGYYLHLLTDIAWKRFYNKKKKEVIYKEGLEKDKNFIWTIKKDWYGQDMLYLQQYQQCVFYTMFSKINEFENVFLDFYPSNAFTRQVNYITNFYLDNAPKEDPNRSYPFLKKEEMDSFVNNTINEIETYLRKI